MFSAFDIPTIALICIAFVFLLVFLGSLNPHMREVLKSGTGTAMVSVIITGIIVTVITGLVNEGLESRQHSNAMIAAYHTQQLDTFKAITQGQNAESLKAAQLISKMKNTAEDLLGYIEGKAEKKAFAEKVDDFNDAQHDFDVNSASTGFSLLYFYNDDTEIGSSWAKVVNSTILYSDCVRIAANDYARRLAQTTDKTAAPSNRGAKSNVAPQLGEGRCTSEGQSIDRELWDLGTLLGIERAEGWTGFKNLKEMEVEVLGRGEDTAVQEPSVPSASSQTQSADDTDLTP